MAIGRGSLAKLLDPSVRKWFIEGIQPERPMEYTRVFNADGMPFNPMTDRQIAALGIAPSMPEGSRFPLDQPIMGGAKTYEAQPFGYGMEVTFPMWDDDLYGIMRIMAGTLGKGCRQRKEVDAFSILNNAFTAGFTGFDGLVLCSTSHTRLDGGAVQPNRPSPDIGFSVTGIMNALFQYETLLNERGQPDVQQPSMVLIHPFNRFVAREIFGSSNRPGTANNEINSILEDELGFMVGHYLSSTTAWFVLAAKGIHELNFFLKNDTIFDSFDDPNTKNGVFTAWQRHTTGFSSYKGTWGTTG